jgi:hypothetical protein
MIVDEASQRAPVLRRSEKSMCYDYEYSCTKYLVRGTRYLLRLVVSCSCSTAVLVGRSTGTWYELSFVSQVRESFDLDVEFAGTELVCTLQRLATNCETGVRVCHNKPKQRMAEE